MSDSLIDLAVERAEDWWEVEALYDTCFAPGRTALSSYRLREGVDPIAGLCLVARDATGILAGAVRNWPVHIDGWACILLGPIAVHPTRQGEGVAQLLMRECLAKATAEGWDRVLLIGDAPYYGRFGFAQLPHIQMPAPTNPKRVLGLALQPGAWDGVTGKVSRAID